MIRFTAFILALGLAFGPAQAMDSSAGPLTVTRMADRLDEPWSLGFLPEGGVLITERGGRLLRVDETGRQAIKGVPKVATRGQGGLLDVLVPRDFAQSRQL
ncbi:Soluble aldose sugar dehydrogenase YliI precursor [Roseovarius gaetbuli]|uniref:Soluble aldose sugar dehydrogenase YliI n=1 Tax=Roseovarius gaetbuli TaxID=1356575 RepID=A0A1X6Y6V5_9RHOB|nr:Soluble aldose sugar dehydrogenase YliI precursor [Roseovarius gaetbuli]